MPAAIAVPAIATAIAGGTAAAGTIYGAHKAGSSAKRAQDIQSRADADTLAIERERDAEARRQWEADQAQRAKEFAAAEEERAFARQQAEIAATDRAYQQQLLREKEARAVPYRQMSQQALGNLGSLLGIDLSGGGPMRSAQMAAPRVQPRMPQQAVAGGMTPLPSAPTLGDLVTQQQGLR